MKHFTMLRMEVESPLDAVLVESKALIPIIVVVPFPARPGGVYVPSMCSAAWLTCTTLPRLVANHD